MTVSGYQVQRTAIIFTHVTGCSWVHHDPDVLWTTGISWHHVAYYQPNTLIFWATAVSLLSLYIVSPLPSITLTPLAWIILRLSLSRFHTSSLGLLSCSLLHYQCLSTAPFTLAPTKQKLAYFWENRATAHATKVVAPSLLVHGRHLRPKDNIVGYKLPKVNIEKGEA